MKLGKLLNIRSGEGYFVKYLVLHHFLLGIGSAIFLTAATVIFLSYYNISELSIVYMLSAVLMLLLARVFNFLEHRLSLKQLSIITVLIISGTVLASWLSFSFYKIAGLALFLLAWHRVIYMLANLEFWGISATVFDVRQSKRLFGLISAGDIPAKLLGYLAVAVLTPWIGVTNLLLVAGVAFLLSIFVLTRVTFDKNNHHSQHHTTHHKKPIITTAQLINKYFGARLIMWLGILAFMVIFALTLINFSFLHEIQSRFDDETKLANFFSLFYAAGNTAIIVTKIFLSGRFINRLGIKKALLIMPGALLALVLVAVQGKFISNEYMVLWTFTIVMLVSEVFKYALHYPLFLSLFQPLSVHLRKQGHVVVEGVVEPLGIGFAGLLLWFMMREYSGIDFNIINTTLVLALVAWIAVNTRTVRAYMQTLREALEKRFMDGSSLITNDDRTQKMILEKLQSPKPEEVVFCMNLLSKNNPKILREKLPELIHHPSLEVRLRTIELAGPMRILSLKPSLLPLITHGNASTIRLQAAAIRAYCEIDRNELDLIEQYTHNHPHEICMAAITGLMRFGGLELSLSAGQQLLNLSRSKLPADKHLACDIIAELQLNNSFDPILRNLDDENDEVVEAAIHAAGVLGNKRFMPKLIQLLNQPAHAKAAARAIALHKDEALHHIAPLLAEEKSRNEVMLGYVCEVLSTIKSERAIEMLTGMLSIHNLQVKKTTARTLMRLGFRAQGKHRKQILREVDLQLDNLHWHLTSCRQLSNKVLCNSLESFAPVLSNYILLMLSLVYESLAVDKARKGITSSDANVRANAFEILENILPKHLFRRFSHLVEHFEYSHSETLSILDKPNKAVEEEAALVTMLKHNLNKHSKWTTIVALNLLSKHGNPESAARFEHMRDHNEEVIRLAANQIFSGQNKHHDLESTKPIITMSEHTTAGELTIFEKVLVLKGTRLFAETPEHILTEIAAITTTCLMHKEKRLFEKGDIGDSMYVIVSGDVKIHHEDTELARISDSDFFGELSLLDDEPRSASATALTEVLLLKIEQDDFYDLMSERTEVMQGVLKILSNRLRDQNVLIRDLKKGTSN